MITIKKNQSTYLDKTLRKYSKIANVVDKTWNKV